MTDMHGWPPCATCDGAGRIPLNNAHANSPNLMLGDCSDCNGTGDCPADEPTRSELRAEGDA